MIPEMTFLFSGVVFGLSSGLSPGPLMTLVISETLRHGTREGIRVAMAPLLTDLPIVFGAVFILSRLSNLLRVIGGIYLLGGAFLTYLAYESISFRGVDTEGEEPVRPQSLKKGVIANFLNPSPYLFWISIGSPILLKAGEDSVLTAMLFIICFYLCLIGSKILVAVIVGKSRFFLKSNHYVYTIRILGILLFIFAILFFRDGLRHLGFI